MPHLPPIPANPVEAIAAQALADELRSQYLAVRVLSDLSVAVLVDLIYTRAIGLGCNYMGIERRFCFADKKLADKRFAELQSEDDVPSGHIARRG